MKIKHLGKAVVKSIIKPVQTVAHLVTPIITRHESKKIESQIRALISECDSQEQAAITRLYAHQQHELDNIYAQMYRAIEEKKNESIALAKEVVLLLQAQLNKEQDFHKASEQIKTNYKLLRAALYACITSDLDTIQLVLEINSFLRSDFMNLNPLHIAAEFDQVAVVNLLCAHGANVYKTNSKNEMPIDIAEAFGNVRVANALKTIAKESDLLMKAVEMEDLQAMQIALKNGADINASHQGGYTALQAAIFYRKNFETVAFLVEQDADLNCCEALIEDHPDARIKELLLEKIKEAQQEVELSLDFDDNHSEHAVHRFVHSPTVDRLNKWLKYDLEFPTQIGFEDVCNDKGRASGYAYGLTMTLPNLQAWLAANPYQSQMHRGMTEAYALRLGEAGEQFAQSQDLEVLHRWLIDNPGASTFRDSVVRVRNEKWRASGYAHGLTLTLPGLQVWLAANPYQSQMHRGMTEAYALRLGEAGEQFAQSQDLEVLHRWLIDNPGASTFRDSVVRVRNEKWRASGYAHGLTLTLPGLQVWLAENPDPSPMHRGMTEAYALRLGEAGEQFAQSQDLEVLHRWLIDNPGASTFRDSVVRVRNEKWRASSYAYGVTLTLADLEAWLAANPDQSPMRLGMRQAREHQLADVQYFAEAHDQAFLEKWLSDNPGTSTFRDIVKRIHDEKWRVNSYAYGLTLTLPGLQAWLAANPDPSPMHRGMTEAYALRLGEAGEQFAQSQNPLGLKKWLIKNPGASNFRRSVEKALSEKVAQQITRKSKAIALLDQMLISSQNLLTDEKEVDRLTDESDVSSETVLSAVGIEAMKKEFESCHDKAQMFLDKYQGDSSVHAVLAYYVWLYKVEPYVTYAWPAIFMLTQLLEETEETPKNPVKAINKAKIFNNVQEFFKKTLAAHRVLSIVGIENQSVLQKVHEFSAVNWLPLISSVQLKQAAIEIAKRQNVNSPREKEVLEELYQTHHLLFIQGFESFLNYFATHVLAVSNMPDKTWELPAANKLFDAQRQGVSALFLRNRSNRFFDEPQTLAMLVREAHKVGLIALPAKTSLKQSSKQWGIAHQLGHERLQLAEEHFAMEQKALYDWLDSKEAEYIQYTIKLEQWLQSAQQAEEQIRSEAQQAITNIKQHFAHVRSELHQDEEKAKQKLQSKAFGSLMGVALGGFLAPIIAPVLVSAESVVGTAMIKGAVIGGVSSGIMGSNPLNGLVKGGLFAGFGSQLTQLLGEGLKHAIVKNAMAAGGMAALSTALHGGRFSTNLGVAMGASVLGDGLLGTQPSSLFLEEVQNHVVRALIASALASSFSRECLTRNWAATTLGATVHVVASASGQRVARKATDKHSSHAIASVGEGTRPTSSPPKIKQKFVAKEPGSIYSLREAPEPAATEKTTLLFSLQQDTSILGYSQFPQNRALAFPLQLSDINTRKSAVEQFNAAMLLTESAEDAFVNPKLGTRASWAKLGGVIAEKPLKAALKFAKELGFPLKTATAMDVLETIYQASSRYSEGLEAGLPPVASGVCSVLSTAGQYATAFYGSSVTMSTAMPVLLSGNYYGAGAIAVAGLSVTSLVSSAAGDCIFFLCIGVHDTLNPQKVSFGHNPMDTLLLNTVMPSEAGVDLTTINSSSPLIFRLRRENKISSGVPERYYGGLERDIRKTKGLVPN